jgi:hypothetical protein
VAHPADGLAPGFDHDRALHDAVTRTHTPLPPYRTAPTRDNAAIRQVVHSPTAFHSAAARCTLLSHTHTVVLVHGRSGADAWWYVARSHSVAREEDRGVSTQRGGRVLTCCTGVGKGG